MSVDSFGSAHAHQYWPAKFGKEARLSMISDEDSLLIADGYDGAILGVAEFNGAASVVYDRLS